VAINWEGPRFPNADESRFSDTSVARSRCAAERRLGCFELDLRRHVAALRNWRNASAGRKAKLLRVLATASAGGSQQTERRTFACSRHQQDPEQSVRQRRFGASTSIYGCTYFTSSLPPLRDHKDYIPLLSEHILRDINANTAKRRAASGAECWTFS